MCHNFIAYTWIYVVKLVNEFHIQADIYDNACQYNMEEVYIVTFWINFLDKQKRYFKCKSTLFKVNLRRKSSNLITCFTALKTPLLLSRNILVNCKNS